LDDLFQLILASKLFLAIMYNDRAHPCTQTRVHMHPCTRMRTRAHKHMYKHAYTLLHTHAAHHYKLNQLETYLRAKIHNCWGSNHQSLSEYNQSSNDLIPQLWHMP